MHSAQLWATMHRSWLLTAGAGLGLLFGLRRWRERRA
jgi:hypothetical protein